MKQLTVKQNKVLSTIKRYINKNGVSPTQPELTKLLGFKSSNSIPQNLNALVKKGYISIRDDMFSRLIVVNER